MDLIIAGGTSVLGYQHLGSTTGVAHRALFGVPDRDADDPSVVGTLLVSMRITPDHAVDYLWKSLKIWGQGALLLPVPLFKPGFEPEWHYAMQWRKSGISWTLYADDDL